MLIKEINELENNEEENPYGAEDGNFRDGRTGSITLSAKKGTGTNINES